MRKKLCLWVGLFAFCLSSLLHPSESFAAEQSVRVALPEFGVKLNGNTVDNSYREYPLLVYKDITYFPMTWYDSRLLGLDAEWTPEEGLNIVKENVASSYAAYKTDRKNSSSLKATVPTIHITINGKKVDNAKEEYPLLSYKDVTYFPLTWKFAHDEFGWGYVWDEEEGLTINSDNPQVTTVDLPAYAGDNDVAVFKGYYYFTETVGSTNQVYRAPVHRTADKEPVYSYDVESLYGFNKKLTFDIKDDELWMVYHAGGAIMGSDVYVKVNDNGKAAIEHQGYLDFKNTAAGTLIIGQFVPPGGNNLSLVPPGKENSNGQSVGNPNLIYGWHITNGGGYAADRSTTVNGNDVYVLASSYPVDHSELNQIYKINIKTNETVKIINSGVRHFKIIHNKLYYVKDEDEMLYSSNLDGTHEQKLSDNKAANGYDEIDGNIYYTAANGEGQFHLYKAEPSKEDTLVLQELIENVRTVNGKLICKLAAGEDYGVKVLDKSGNLQIAITDSVSQVFAYDDFILLVSAEDKSVKLLK